MSADDAEYRIWPELFRWAARGAPQRWYIMVVLHPDSTATIRTTYGKAGGKQQVAEKHIKDGKNLGRANATTAQQQAIAEATSMYTSRLEREQYAETPEASYQKVMYSPMLAHKYPDYQDRVDWATAYVQPKFDGFRCVARRVDGRVTLFSRSGDVFTTVPHVTAHLERVLPADAVWDGELYLHGETLQKISSLVNKEQPETQRLIYNVYDSFDNRPYAERQAELKGRLRITQPPSTCPVFSVPTFRVTGEARLMEFQALCLSKGYEGAMLRHGPEVYVPGKRSVSLLKVKTFIDAEFTIIGYKAGDGSFADKAVFVCSVGDTTFDVTAPGTHQQKREALVNGAAYIGRQLTVKFAGYTDNGKPFHPVAKGYR